MGSIANAYLRPNGCVLPAASTRASNRVKLTGLRPSARPDRVLAGRSSGAEFGQAGEEDRAEGQGEAKQNLHDE
jgi:hypothetical protein